MFIIILPNEAIQVIYSNGNIAGVENEEVSEGGEGFKFYLPAFYMSRKN